MSSKSHPLVRLDHLRGPALIVRYPTGIVYCNQACGTACLQPELEGALVPFDVYTKFEGSYAYLEGELTDYFTGQKHKGAGAPGGLDNEDADFIDRLLQQINLDLYVSVDRECLRDSMEAWVWIVLELPPKVSTSHTVQRFVEPHMTGVLIWPNSD